MKAYLLKPLSIVYSLKSSDYNDAQMRARQLEALASAEIEEIEVQQVKLKESVGYSFGSFERVDKKELDGRLFFVLSDAIEVLTQLLDILKKEQSLIEKAEQKIKALSAR